MLSYILVAAAAPMGAWVVDRLFLRGEFSALVREAFDLPGRRPRPPRTKRTRLRITVVR